MAGQLFFFFLHFGKCIFLSSRYQRNMCLVWAILGPIIQVLHNTVLWCVGPEMTHIKSTCGWIEAELFWVSQGKMHPLHISVGHIIIIIWESMLMVCLLKCKWIEEAEFFGVFQRGCHANIYWVKEMTIASNAQCSRNTRYIWLLWTTLE